MIRLDLCALFVLAAACSNPPPPEAPTPPAPPRLAAPPPPPPAATPEREAPDVLSLSEDIRSACGIQSNETFFAYNSDRVDDAASRLLQQVAECFTTGALSGRTLAVVGHTDPRGDDEYNYALGGRRAAGVERRLAGMGMADSQLSTTSRGENEALGTDEASWRRDRRVDLKLGS